MESSNEESYGNDHILMTICPFEELLGPLERGERDLPHGDAWACVGRTHEMRSRKGTSHEHHDKLPL